MATLIYSDTAGADRRAVLSGDRVHLGRQHDCEVVIADPLVSRKHCVLEFEEGAWVVRDLASRYGTFHNEERIEGPRRLRNGDKIRLGNTALRFDEDDLPTRKGKKRPDNEPQTTGDFQPQLLWEAKVRSLGKEYAEALAEPGSMAKEEITSLLEVVNAGDVTRKVRLTLLSQTVGEAIAALHGDADRILGVTVDASIRILQAERGFVLLRDGVATTKFGRNMGDLQSGSATISEMVAAQGQPVLTIDAKNDMRFRDARSIMLKDIRALICVPVHDKKGTSIGAIFLDGKQGSAQFDQDAIALLDVLGRRAAEAVEGALRRSRETRLAKGRAPRTMQGDPDSTLADLMLGSEPASRVVTLLSVTVDGIDARLDEQPAAEAIAALNTTLTALHDDLLAHEGTFDRYTVDGFAALFGAPRTQSDHALRAVRAALKMRSRSPGRIAVVVHTGRSVVGNVGSERRMEFTALGPAARALARMIAVARPGEVLVSRATKERLLPTVRTTVLPDDRQAPGTEPLYRVDGDL